MTAYYNEALDEEVKRKQFKELLGSNPSLARGIQIYYQIKHAEEAMKLKHAKMHSGKTIEHSEEQDLKLIEHFLKRKRKTKRI